MKTQPATAWVWNLLTGIDVDRLPQHLRITLMGLATYANSDGTDARPSSETIAAGSGNAGRTVRHHLRALDQLGVTFVTGRISIGKRRQPVRRIVRETLERMVEETTFARPSGMPRNTESENGLRGHEDVCVATGGLLRGHPDGRNHPKTIPLDHPLRVAPTSSAPSEDACETSIEDDQEEEPVNQLAMIETGSDVIRIDGTPTDSFDRIWAAFAALFGDPLPSQRKLRAKICHELADAGFDGTDVTGRAEQLTMEWGSTKFLTETSLLKHWGRYEGAVATVDMEAVKEQRRRLEIDAERAKLAAQRRGGR